MSEENPEVQAEAAEVETQEVETQAEAPPEPEGAKAETEEAAASEEQEPRRKRGAEKRIAELVREREEAKREAERYKRMAEGRSDMPNPDDFDGGEYDPRYIAAVARAEIQNDMRKERAEQEQAYQAELQKQRRAQMEDRLAEARSRYDDFDKVAFNPDLPITDAMAEVISESDKAGELAYYLGQNPREAARISELGPLQATRELVRIESTLAAPKKVTEAPEPIKPIAGKVDGGSIDPSKMSTAEWMEWRRGQLSQR